jgi:chromosomal replication initiator protein
MNSIWSQIKRILEGSLNPGIYQVWIKPLGAVIEDGRITLVAQNEFVAAWVRERLIPEIVQAAAQVTGRAPTVQVTTKPAGGPKAPAGRELTVPASPPAVNSQDGARCTDGQVFRFCFDQFVVGPSNALAYEASLGLCRDTLPASQLFISAGPGLGKTHLTQSMGNHLTDRANRHGLKVVYVTAEEFSSRLILAIKMREVDRFKAYFRQNVDILILEDIHFFQGKLKLQDELLNTISALQARGCRVVLTSSFLPKELSGLDNQLASRLCAGFLATIEQPDFQTRRNILEHKAKKHQVLLPGEVADLLADRIRTDIRQLESCLNNLVLKARILGQSITMDLAWDVLKNYHQDRGDLDLDHIVDFICSAFDINPDHLASKSRKHNLVLARNTAFFLARKHTTLSLADIGLRFNRKHSTVVKGITAVEQHLSLQTPLGRQIERAIDSLEG